MTADPLKDDWARLHPLSPVAKGGRALAGLAAVAASRQAEGDADRTALAFDGGLFVFAIVAAAISWRVTKWRVHQGDLQIEGGLIRRQSVQIPLSQVQSVDVVRPLVARLLGLSELRVELAGAGHAKGRLSYLEEDKAIKVRAQLLALAHGLAEETPEAPERPLVAVDNGRLVTATLLGAPTILLLGYVIALIVVAITASQALGPLLGTAVPIGLAAVSATVRRLNLEFSFALAESPDGLRVRSGLLQTRSSTIPRGRIQAVRLVEPILWRPFGWCRLEVDVAHQRQGEQGQQGSRRVDRALLPVGTRTQADALLASVLPGAFLLPAEGSGAPRRARIKAPLSWLALRFWHDDYYAMTRTGRFTRRTVVVPLVKVQSFRRTQGPVQRRLRVASLHLDPAGKSWQADGHDRDVAELDHLLTVLPPLASAARKRVAAARATSGGTSGATIGASAGGSTVPN